MIHHMHVAVSTMLQVSARQSGLRSLVMLLMLCECVYEYRHMNASMWHTVIKR